MFTVYDVRMLLKQFGTFIYTSDRIGDIILMEDELKELYNMGFITNEQYATGRLALHKEKRILESKRGENV